MEKTLGYIFGSLRVSEAAIGGIIKDLKTQNRINKLAALSLVMCGVGLHCAAKHCLNNAKRIEELEAKIEMMEQNLKGE